jgi:NADPH2:quinone reductase
VYPLEKLVKGLDDLEKRKTWGKAIVRVKADDSASVKAKL